MDDGLIASRGDFHAALRLAFAEVALRGCRELVIADDDFGDWPLSEPDVLANLTTWAAPHRRLVVLAMNFDTVVRRHARFVAWRRTYSHVVDTRTNDDLERTGMPTLLLARGLVGVHLSDAVHCRGRLSHATADLLRWGEEVDAVLQRSAESFPPTTLGL